jgi:hypothetical protein
MNIYNSKVFVAFLFGSMILVSCGSAQTAQIITPSGTISSTPSPTTLPYWNLLPLDWEPDGGWTTLQMEEFDIAFKIPAAYQTGSCGKHFIADKGGVTYKGQLIGFEGGTIRIHIYSKWEDDWEKLVIKGEALPGSHLVTPVERFTLAEIPAVRFIATNPDSKTLLYTKGVWAFYHDRLYSFSFLSLPDHPSCDALPLSEEQVFEYLVSTVEFLE